MCILIRYYYIINYFETHFSSHAFICRLQVVPPPPISYPRFILQADPSKMADAMKANVAQLLKGIDRYVLIIIHQYSVFLNH